MPELALWEPVLYYACLAFASHVMVLWGKLDKSVQEQYHDKAIGLLIPLLSSHTASSRAEALLATTVLLRMIEQFSEIAEDAQRHLQGAFSLFTTTGELWTPFQTGVKGSAFWIYLRASMRVCFLSEQGCKFDLELCEDVTGLTSAPDEVWTNRMSYLLARLCNACWAELDPVVRSAKLQELRILIDEWEKGLPASFQPWYFCQQVYEPFPTVRYLGPWHGNMFRVVLFLTQANGCCSRRMATVLYSKGDVGGLR